MARKRYIKPEFFGDPDLAELRIEARYLYAGLWPWMDRQGLIDADPRLIRANVFPHDEKVTAPKVRSWIDELVQHGFVIRFPHQGKTLLYCPKFSTHQRLFPDEKAVFNVSDELLEQLRNDTVLPHCSDVVPPQSSHSTVQVEVRVREEVKERVEEYLDQNSNFDFESVYAFYPRKEGKAKGLQKLRARNWTEESFREFESAVKEYARKCRMERTDAKYIKHFVTFVGTDEAETWRDYIPIKQERAAIQINTAAQPVSIPQPEPTPEERANAERFLAKLRIQMPKETA